MEQFENRRPFFFFPTPFLHARVANLSLCITLLLGSVGLDQGWPHFLCGGHKSAFQKIGGHKNMFKKGLAGKA